MKCEDCGAELPFKIYGDVKCEYCNTPNHVPVPDEVKEAFDKKPEPIAKGFFKAVIPGTHCRVNVGKHEFAIRSGWITGGLHVKVDGKKVKRLWFTRGSWVFEVGENYVKLVLEQQGFSTKYKIYVT